LRASQAAAYGWVSGFFYLQILARAATTQDATHEIAFARKVWGMLVIANQHTTLALLYLWT
jgi:hypothetical protein